jgi:hypothetical protein
MGGSMSRYFFDLKAIDPKRDGIGTEYSTAEDALRAAEQLAHEANGLSNYLGYDAINVRDERGELIFQVAINRDASPAPA